jgi:AraC family transcriptional regulator
MQQTDRPTIDFRQTDAAIKFFDRAPVVASHASDWNTIHVEHHLLEATDTGEHTLALHCLCLSLNSFRCDRWLDEQFYTDACHSGLFGIIPAAMAHRAASSSDQIEFVTLSFDATLLTQVAQEWVNPQRLQLLPHPAIQQDLMVEAIGLALKAEMESGCMGGKIYGETLTNALVIHLLRHYCNYIPQIQSYSGGLPSPKLKQVLDYIHNNLEEALSLEAIAAQIGMSHYYFCSLFKQSLGVSPWQYVIQQRVDRAKQLLKTTELPISDIALLCGFASQTHLNKHFYRLVGITPKNYRKQIP